MKNQFAAKLLTAFFLILFASNATSQQIDKKKSSSLYQWGMYNVGDSMLIDQAEVSIDEWLTFMYYNDLYKYPNFVRKAELTNAEKTSLLETVVDPTLMPVNKQVADYLEETLGMNNRSKRILNFQGEGFPLYLPIEQPQDYSKAVHDQIQQKLMLPITGITFEQARAYCKWKTKLDSLRYFDPRLKPLTNSMQEMECYEYTLLDPGDFDKFIPGNDSLSEDGEYSTFNYKGSKPADKPKILSPEADYGKKLLRVGSYMGNEVNPDKEIFLLDIQGNAAEMTSIKGIAKGGSYVHAASEAEKGKTISYTNAEAWLGFRCQAKRRDNVIPIRSFDLKEALGGSWVCEKILDRNDEEAIATFGSSGDYLRFDFKGKNLHISEAPYDQGLPVKILYNQVDSMVYILKTGKYNNPIYDHRLKIVHLNDQELIVQSNEWNLGPTYYYFRNQEHFQSIEDIPEILDCGSLVITNYSVDMVEEKANPYFLYNISLDKTMFYEFPKYKSRGSSPFALDLANAFDIDLGSEVSSDIKEITLDFTVGKGGIENITVFKSNIPAVNDEIIELFDGFKGKWKALKINGEITSSKLRLHIFFYNSPFIGSENNGSESMKGQDVALMKYNLMNGRVIESDAYLPSN